jgi:cobalt-zinc-cadmium efflux system outer membrane protein
MELRAPKYTVGGSRKPIAGRFCFAAALFLSLAVVTSAPAQPAPVVVTEDEVVANALDVSAVESLFGARAAGIEAEAVRATTWRNPDLGYTREQTFEDAGAVGEDIVLLEQEFLLSGRQSLVARAARERARAVKLDGEMQQRVLAGSVRRAFFELLTIQERLDVYADWLGLMEQVESELERRVAAGESAPYELQRLQKEIADIEAAAAADRADLASRQAQLAALTGLSEDEAPRLRADGELMPTSVPPDAALLEAIGERPDMRAAAARIDAASALDKAASRWWIPDPAIQAGYKGVSAAGERAHGFVAGLSLALPFFSTAKSERMAARALRIEAESRRQIVERRIRGTVLGLAKRIRSLEAAAETYRAEGVETAAKVVETARLAYAAGELGILELIDGYRGLVEARLTVVEMAADARRSEIELWESLMVPTTTSMKSGNQ